MKSFFEHTLLFLCVSTLTLFIWLFTLQNTVLNREVVKGWFHDSNAYSVLPQQLLTVQPNTNTETTGLLTPAGVAETLHKTFTPDYTEKQATVVVDSFYDWLEGKQQTIDFSLDLSDKKNDFSSNLAAAVEPQIAALPACDRPSGFDAQNPTCIPPGYTAGELAQRVATETTNQVDLFKQPITPQTVGAESTTTASPGNAVSLITIFVIVLPIVAILTGAGYLLLQSEKLVATKRLSARLFFSIGFLALIGIVLVTLNANPNLIPGLIQNEFMPLILLIMNGVGGYLLLWSGSITLLAGLIWLGITLYQRKHNSTSQFQNNVAK